MVPILWFWLRAPSLGSSLPALSLSSFHCPAVWDSSHREGNLPVLCLLCADDSGSRGSCCLVNGIPRNSAASGVCCRVSLWQPYRLFGRSGCSVLLSSHCVPCTVCVARSALCLLLCIGGEGVPQPVLRLEPWASSMIDKDPATE